jgi:hypothetical protein
VVLSDSGVIQWIRNVLQLRSDAGAGKNDKFLPTTYKRVTGGFQRACNALGLPPMFTTHSLRRGGATELLIRQCPIENIMEFGRWASLTSCKLYLRRGEVALLRCRSEYSDFLQKRIDLVSSIGPLVFRVCKLL